MNRQRYSEKFVRKPYVDDSKLKSIVADNYANHGALNLIGDGSLAAAIFYERQTGKKVGGRYHTQKGNEYLIRLEKWEQVSRGKTKNDKRVVREEKAKIRKALSS